jgi:hypothetical protein
MYSNSCVSTPSDVYVSRPGPLEGVLQSSLPSSPSAQAKYDDAGQHFDEYAAYEQNETGCLLV